jgi:hypothetical protein
MISPKKIAIMQPYIFPYLGYFSLLKNVDSFIFLDDVSYINKGWINRNRINTQNGVSYFVIPLNSASQNKKINEIEVVSEKKWRDKLLKTIEYSYSKAPFYKKTLEIFEKIILSSELYISEVAKNSILEISRYLQLRCEFINSSSIFNNSHLKGEDRILDICKQIKCSNYYNLPGGKDLYHIELFLEQGVELNFINPIAYEYNVSPLIYQPNLSIVDVLMFNSPEIVREKML